MKTYLFDTTAPTHLSLHSQLHTSNDQSTFTHLFPLLYFHYSFESTTYSIFLNLQKYNLQGFLVGQSQWCFGVYLLIYFSLSHWGPLGVGELESCQSCWGQWGRLLGLVSSARLSSLTLSPQGFSPQSLVMEQDTLPIILAPKPANLENFLSVGNQQILCPENGARSHPNPFSFPIN